MLHGDNLRPLHFIDTLGDNPDQIAMQGILTQKVVRTSCQRRATVLFDIELSDCDNT
jgi:hypothetical protein